jgi:TRAP transporter TAXI family solute receptor
MTTPSTRRALAAALLLTLGAGRALAAPAVDVTIMTGPPGGTYHRLGQDIGRLLRERGFSVTVEPSNGSVDNVAAIAQRPGIPLGIVQSDVMAFVAELRDNPDTARIAQGVHMVFPLHEESVHVLGRRPLATLEDLGGRRVAIGAEGTGTYVTARRLLRLADVRPAAVVPVDGAEALRQLKAGEIDAMVYVVSPPVRLFRHGITTDDRLALLEVTHKAVRERYAAIEIPPGTYEWQPAPVKTVSVTALLVTFDPERRHCEPLGRLARELAQGFAWLRANGTPVWQRVRLDAPVAGWPQYDCVGRYVAAPDTDSPAASTHERNPVADAINKALGKE